MTQNSADSVESINEIIHELIDFVNAQVGAYMDALAGYAGHCTKVERQVHRVTRQTKVKVNDKGEKVVVWASYEDPTQPDIILNRIIRANDYLAANAQGGSNEQMHARAIVVFLFTFWELDIRPRLAKSKGLEPEAILSDIMGDLRVLRNVILHAKSIMRADKYKGLKKLKDKFIVDKPIYIGYQDMHDIFVLIKQDCARILLESTNAISSSPFSIEEIRDVAIQRTSKHTADEL